MGNRTCSILCAQQSFEGFYLCLDNDFIAAVYEQVDKTEEKNN